MITDAVALSSLYLIFIFLEFRKWKRKLSVANLLAEPVAQTAINDLWKVMFSVSHFLTATLFNISSISGFDFEGTSVGRNLS